MKNHIENDRDANKTMCGIAIADDFWRALDPWVSRRSLTEIDGFNVCKNCNWVAKNHLRKEVKK